MPRDITIGERRGAIPVDIFSITIGALLGFIAAVLLGMRNGEQLAEGAEAIVTRCQDACDQADARHDAGLGAVADRIDAHGRAVAELADRCVLTVPARDRLVVTRARQE